MDSDAVGSKRLPFRTWRAVGKAFAVLLTGLALFVDRLDAILTGKAVFYLTVAGRLFVFEMLVLAFVLMMAGMFVEELRVAIVGVSYLWTTRYQNARIARRALVPVVIIMIGVVITTSVSLKYLAAKRVALADAPSSFVNDATHLYGNGDSAQAVRILRSCQVVIGSDACGAELEALTSRLRMAGALRELAEELPSGNVTKPSQLQWAYQLDRDRALLQRDVKAIKNELTDVRKQYDDGVASAYRHELDRATEILSGVNGRITGYGEAHRIVQELQSAPNNLKDLSPFKYPYLTALFRFGPDEFTRRCTKAFALNEQFLTGHSLPSAGKRKSGG